MSITSLLPLLRDQAHFVATVKHVMQKVYGIVAHRPSTCHYSRPANLCLDKTGAVAMARRVWRGVMFGGLHIEMATLRSLGSLLKDSGWTGALVEAGAASSGTAHSFLPVSSVTKTR